MLHPQFACRIFVHFEASLQGAVLRGSMPRLRQGAVLLLLSVATICSHAWEVRSLDTNSDDSPRLGEDAGTQKNGELHFAVRIASSSLCVRSQV